MYNFIAASGNKKTGPIPQTYSGRDTCPDTCSFKNGGGCYAEGGNVRMHWDKNTNKSWDVLIAGVKGIAKGRLWRHNVAGDLPGKNRTINERMLNELIAANRGKRGFTFTHKPVKKGSKNGRLIRHSNDNGFVINLSADNLKEADRLHNLGVGPVVVVLPSDSPNKLKTPEGKHVIVCPAQVRDDMTCEKCGLCAVSSRKAIIGFKAHGIKSKKVSLKVIQKRVDELPFMHTFEW